MSTRKVRKKEHTIRINLIPWYLILTYLFLHVSCHSKAIHFSLRVLFIILSKSTSMQSSLKWTHITSCTMSRNLISLLLLVWQIAISILPSQTSGRRTTMFTCEAFAVKISSNSTYGKILNPFARRRQADEGSSSRSSQIYSTSTATRCTFDATAKVEVSRKKKTKKSSKFAQLMVSKLS